VNQLIENDRTFQVGTLIKRLWSGLNIPLHHNHPSQQPLGGISDLTNKGDFDKLVISEFAYDDDVFMSRIANNEALYIQREVPPEADKFERILLLDVSLKNWGNPKILSFASAIAIARHPKTDIQCRIFVVGQDFKEVSLKNVNSVIDSLGELSGKLDCSAGLDLFFQQNKVNSNNQEVFLFSSEESLKLVRMQNAMSNYSTAIKYVFEMEMEGIKVYKNQNKGRKMLQHIIMPLDELWEKKRDELPRRSKNTGLDEIPLLYPVERNYQAIFHDGKDFYTYINGNLFLFVNAKFDKGFKKIASNLPFGNGKFAIKINSKGQKLFLYYQYHSEQEVGVWNLDTQELKSNVITYNELNNKKISVFGCNGEFYFTNGVLFWCIDDDFKIVPAEGILLKEAFLNYTKKRTSFADNFMNSKFKYSVIKKVKGFSVVNDRIDINGFEFVHLEFKKKHYNNIDRGDVKVIFKEKVNLILKNRGTSFLDVVKEIKVSTGKSLVECKRIVDEDFGVVLNNATRAEAEDLKKILESKGAICYTETLFFESKDGSKVTSKDGILVFESSKEDIEKFYIPFIIDGRTIMATESEYSGNDYFLPEHDMESIKEQMFLEKYMNPFIQNVKEHGA
jgi:ribosomal protein L7/L12